MSSPDSVPLLNDVLPIARQASTFAQLTRDVESVSLRIADSSHNTTILAPLNSAFTALPRKPWEDPEEYRQFGAEAYEGKSGEDRARKNLDTFVERHIIDVNPWDEGDKRETLAHTKIWWEKKDGKILIQPGNVEVERVAQKVANGEVWLLKGVLDSAR